MSRALLLTAALLVGAGCSRPASSTPDAAPTASAPTPASDARPSVPVTPTAFAAGDRYEVTSRLTLAQGALKVETRSRLLVRIDARRGDRLEATIEVTGEETRVTEDGVPVRTQHRPRTVRFEGGADELVLLGAGSATPLLTPQLPQRLLRSGVQDGASWSGQRQLRIAGLPVEVDVAHRAALSPGQVRVTSTSRAARDLQDGITLTIEGQAISVFDRDGADLPRSLRGRFTTAAAGGPGADASSTVAIDVRTRRLS